MDLNACIVWISKDEARLLYLSEQKMERLAVKAQGADLMLVSLADSLDGAAQILVVGPDSAKQELVEFLNHERPNLAKKVIACETNLSGTDQALASMASKYLLRKT